MSYDGLALGKWPADQAVTLASLFLCDQIHGTTLSAGPIEGWLTEMEERVDPGLNLHHSAVSELIWYALPTLGLRGGRYHRTSPLIGEALLFSGATARYWFGEWEPAPLPDRELPPPWGAVILLFIVAGSSVWLVFRVVRRVPAFTLGRSTQGKMQ